jgi:hypothetical protein
MSPKIYPERKAPSADCKHKNLELIRTPCEHLSGLLAEFCAEDGLLILRCRRCRAVAAELKIEAGVFCFCENQITEKEKQNA